MSIDLTLEKPHPLADVPNLPCIPRRRGGRKLHRSTVMRWVNPGLRGVRLEAIRVGGTLCTTIEALQRFFERLAAPRPEPQPTSGEKRQRELQQIEQELNAARI
jgi:hypothetical protein